MPNWTRLTAPATGAFNTGIITRIAGVVIALMLAVLFLVTTFFSTTPTEPEPVTAADAPAGNRAGAQLGARVADIEQRAALERNAADRTLGAQRDTLTGGQVTPAFDPTTGETLTGAAAAGPIVAVTQAEADLREILRLEAIERRTRSIRSAPVAISYRTLVGRSPGGARRCWRARRLVGQRREPRREYAAPRRPSDLPGHADRAASPRSTNRRSGARRRARGRPADDAGWAAVATPHAGTVPTGPTSGATVPRGDPLNPAIVRCPRHPPRMGADL